jgi:YHS domain-containing protein
MVGFNRVRRGLVVLAGLLIAGAAAHAGSVVYGASNGPALQGFDPVAYFTEGAPKEGDARFAHQWNGATWRFASAENRDRFQAEPERFAPQYGGYCAFAMSGGSFSPGDANRWRIVDGKLYLNANRFAQTLWESNIPRRVSDADGHWPAKKQELEAAP